MEQRRCAHCGCPLALNPRARNQRYCGHRECQRARKRSWQCHKIATDPDYKANQQACDKAWRERNPRYWRDYRINHPDYTQRNRLLQKARRGRSAAGVAKMDASAAESPSLSGTYWLIRETGVAKMDASACKVVLIQVT